MAEKNIEQLGGLPSAHFQNEFLVEIDDAPVDLSTIDLRVGSTSIPGPETQIAERSWGSHTIRYPANINRSGTWSVDIMIHQDLDIRGKMAEWNTAVEDAVTGTGDPFEEVRATAFAQLLNKRSGSGSEMSEGDVVRLDYVVPEATGNIDVDNESQDSQSTFSLDFAYSNLRYNP